MTVLLTSSTWYWTFFKIDFKIRCSLVSTGVAVKGRNEVGENEKKKETETVGNTGML